MLYPRSLYLTEDEFKSLVESAENAWLEKNQKCPIKDRASIVQFWLHTRKEIINPEHINNLRKEYSKHWSKVEIEWVEDRTITLMICLIP